MEKKRTRHIALTPTQVERPTQAISIAVVGAWALYLSAAVAASIVFCGCSSTGSVAPYQSFKAPGGAGLTPAQLQAYAPQGFNGGFTNNSGFGQPFPAGSDSRTAPPANGFVNPALQFQTPNSGQFQAFPSGTPLPQPGTT